MAHTHAEPEPPGVVEAATRMREDLTILRGAIDRQRADLEARLSSLVHERPLAALTGAFVIGYGLGGGFLTRWTLPLAGIVLRIGMSDLIARTFNDLDDTESATASAPGADERPA